MTTLEYITTFINLGFWNFLMAFIAISYLVLCVSSIVTRSKRKIEIKTECKDAEDAFLSLISIIVLAMIVAYCFYKPISNFINAIQ